MNRRLRGMTLIELLAAVTLSAVLMIVLLSVTSTIRRDMRITASRAGTGDTARGLHALLAHDFQLARRAEIDGDKLVLTGYALLNETTQRSTQLPAQVTYQLLPAGLVRQQVDTMSLTNREASVELVALDVRAWAARPTATGGMRVELAWNDEHRPRLVETFTISEEAPREKD